MDLFGLKRFRMMRRLQKGVSAVIGTLVKSGMSQYVVTIAPDKSAIDAATIMVGESVSAIVVEKDNKPIGILTERDFITKVPLSQKVFNTPVSKFMSATKETPPVLRVFPEDKLTEARKILKEKHVRKLVVTDKEDLIQGILTQTDLCRLVYDNVTVTVKTTQAPFLVKDIMTRNIVSVSRKSTFAKAKQLMTKKNLTAMPVMEGKEYVGIFTEYDVVMQFYDAGGKLVVKGIPEIMKRPIKVIPADVNIFEANAIMIFEKVRRLMVMDEGKIVGLISQTDVVHGCFDHIEWLKKQLAEGKSFKKDELIEIKGKEFIISKYAGPHARMYTMQ